MKTSINLLPGRKSIVTMWMLLFAASSAWAQVDAAETAWDRWAAHDSQNTVVVDHKPMTAILNFIHVEDGERTVGINYAGLHGRGLEFVQAYIEFLESVPVSKLNRDEQLAFWLNLHNAQVIEFIVRGGSSRIIAHRGKPGEPGDWWSERRLMVEGQALSLEDIEQNILLRHWQDPIVLYGMCYGVGGSPVIGDTAFNGAGVRAQLEHAARSFINDSSNVKVGRGKAALEVSSLYVWNKPQLFNNEDEKVIAHLRAYSNGRLSDKLASVDSISKHRFDWRSNAYVPRRIDLPSQGQSRGGGS
jgi:hypothetical protein